MKSIDEVIENFKKVAQAEGWDLAEWHGQCFDTCLSFQEALFDAGLISEDGRETEWDLEHLNEPQYSVRHPVLSGCDHWVFRLGTTYYDWALPQFGIETAYPLVWNQA